MKLVTSLEEIRENMLTLDNYLSNKIESEYTFALNLIKKGICFIAVKNKDGYSFYPSRFIGYVHNNMNDHLNNDTKDGRKTNPAISLILNKRLDFNSELEKEYRLYCEKLGFVAKEKAAFGGKRKYWRI